MNNKKILLNTIMNLSLQLLSVVITLFIPKMILEAYGSELNGLISSINQIMMYLALVESGLTQVAVVSLYKPLVFQDTKKINGQLTILGRFYRQTGIMYLILLATVSILYPLIVIQPYDTRFLSTLILVLGLHYFIDFYFIGKYKVLLVADQKQYVLSFIQIITNILFFISEILLLKNEAPITWVKLMIPVAHLIQLMLIRLYISREYVNIRFNEEEQGEPLSGRSSAVLHQITGLVMSSTDITLLTLQGVGLKEISVYSVYNTVTLGVNSFLNAVTNAAVPSFGRALVQNDGEIRYHFSIFVSLFYFLIFCFFGPMLLLYTSFVSIYTANVYDVNYVRESLAILFSFCFVMNAIKSPYIMLIQSSGRYKETKKATIIEALINLIITVPMIYFMGVNGALIGTLCAHVYRYVQLLIYGKKYHNISIRENVVRITTYFTINIMIAMLINSYWKTKIVIRTWTDWIIISVIVALIYVIINLFVFFMIDRDNQRYYVHIIKDKGNKIWKS